MTEPLYVVRDGALQTESEPMTREAAGREATRLTIEAGNRGEAVAVRGYDRFTTARAPAPAPVTVTATPAQWAAIRSAVCKAAPIKREPNMTQLTAVIDSGVPVSTAPGYTALEAEAAVMIWEAMLEAHQDSTIPKLSEAFNAAGLHAMRHHALGLARFALQVHAALDADNLPGGPYGYGEEIIPAFVAAVIWTGGGYVLPSLEGAVKQVAYILEQGQ